MSLFPRPQPRLASHAFSKASTQPLARSAALDQYARVPPKDELHGDMENCMDGELL